jgi:hypothetical protein
MISSLEKKVLDRGVIVPHSFLRNEYIIPHDIVP